MQQALVLFILCILCIDIQLLKMSIPGGRTGVPPPPPHPLGSGRPARILSLWRPLSFPAMLQAVILSAPHRPGRNKAMAPFPVDSRREMAEAVPFVRAGRPRSQ